MAVNERKVSDTVTEVHVFCSIPDILILLAQDKTTYIAFTIFMLNKNIVYQYC